MQTRTITVDYARPRGYDVGYRAENNFTLLALPIPAELEGADSYRVYFESTVGEYLQTEILTPADGYVTVKITSDVVPEPGNMAAQLVAFADGEIVGYAPVITGSAKVSIPDGTERLSHSLAAEIALNTAARHSHANKAVLDKFAESDGKPTYDGEALGGGGTSDFIIKMTVTSDDNGNYTVTSCDATVEQIDAAVAAEKRVVLIASYEGIILNLPMLEGDKGNTYYFGMFLNGHMMISFVEKIDGSTSEWQFLRTQIEAESVNYSNATLPSVTNVRGALDELVPKSHTHANKDTLDKLSDSNGKLQYNGSDVGLKPVKGTDYWTEADKTEIVQSVIESLGGNPIFGIVDENNNIIVSGDLPDGTYTVKYEMEDGSTVDIGDLVLDTNVYYTVTNTLTNCTNSNSATQAVGGGSYSATITANSGYELSSVVVTMGGTDITSSAVSGEIINIETVTGDIVITAVAEEIVIVNQIPISTDSSGNLFVGANGEAGYKTDTRLSVSGSEKTQSGHETTGFIPAKYADTIYLKNITITSSTSEVMCFYDSNYAVLVGTYTEFVFGATSGGVVSKKVSDIALDSLTTNADKIAFVRISANEINANSVITINQPIS